MSSGSETRNKTTTALSGKTPYLRTSFLVEIDGIAVGAFDGLSSLQSTTNMVEYHEGAGWNMIVKKIPADTNCDNFVLRRLLMYSDELWKWYQEIVNNSTGNKKRDITIRSFKKGLGDSQFTGDTELTMTLTGAWPIRYKLDDFSKTTQSYGSGDTKRTVKRRYQRANFSEEVTEIYGLCEEVEIVYDSLSIEGKF